MNPFITYPGQAKPRFVCTKPTRCLDLIDGPFCTGDPDCLHLGVIIDGKICRIYNSEPVKITPEPEVPQPLEKPIPEPKKHRYFTDEEIDVMIGLHGKVSAGQIGKILGRSRQSIFDKLGDLRRLGMLSSEKIKGFGYDTKPK